MSKKAFNKIERGLQEALRHQKAMAAIYQVLDNYPNYALMQMNDHLANAMVTAVRDALYPQDTKND